MNENGKVSGNDSGFDYSIVFQFVDRRFLKYIFQVVFQKFIQEVFVKGQDGFVLEMLYMSFFLVIKVEIFKIILKVRKVFSKLFVRYLV